MKIEQEPDRIATRRLIALSVTCVVVGAVAVVVAWLLLDSGAAAAAPRRHPSKPPVLESALFENSARGASLRRQQLAELEHYGWVDRSRGIAKIPIERAIELRAQEAR